MGAGDMVEVGAWVARFRVGDRVVGYAAGSDKGRNRAAEGAFQEYVVLLAHWRRPSPNPWRSRTPPSCRWVSRQRRAAYSRRTSSR